MQVERCRIQGERSRGVPRDAGWLVAIGLTGAVLRLAFAWQYTGQPLGQFPWVDEASYWSWAQAILQGGWWPVRPFYQDPLYPYWLACLMGVVGTNVAASADGLGRRGSRHTARRLLGGADGLGRAEGLLAAWATALYGPLIFADGSLEKEGLAALCTAVALALDRSGLEVGPAGAAATAGAAWGVVGLLRSNALLIAPLAAGWLLSGATEQTGQDRNQRLRLARHMARWVFRRHLAGRGCQHGRLEPARVAGNHVAARSQFLYRQRSRRDGDLHGPPFRSGSSGL